MKACEYEKRKINILDQSIINQIAAGEIIKDPADIVKELLENSIDAGAKNIIIEIENGGKSLIKISDDGCGMNEFDLEICVKKHATSKFISLNNIYTLGFRGEALFAIHEVGLFSIISREQDAIFAHKYSNFGEDAYNIVKCSGNKGTLVEIRNIFYNLPVRLKFLKTDIYETKKIEDWIEKLSLCYSGINFIFRKGDKIENYNSSSIFFKIFKITIDKSIPISFSNGRFKIFGNILTNNIYEKRYV